jgi:PAS domain S-box-containing protein
MRKQAEKALKESEEKFKDLFNNAEVGMYRSRLDGSEVLDSNDKYLAILGRTREETIGRPSQILWADPVVREKMVETLKVNGFVSDLECRLMKKDGTVIYCITSLRLYPEQGVLEGSIMDITERKKLAETAQRTDKLEALGLLAGGIAHDFNNLLGGIYGYIDMAQDECAPADKKLKGYLSKAIKTFTRAKDLTRQLITFSKGGDPVKKTGSLIPVLRDNAQFALSGSNAACEFDVDDDLWHCDFDENQMGQVVDNIVINARQAMPAGGSVNVSAVNVTLGPADNPVLKAGNYVRVSIRDTGIGIPASILPRIFDPFFTTKQKGNGLGLATVYSIIKKHGGDIVVSSEPDKGATFAFFIPATDKMAGKPAVEGTAVHQGSGSVLLMDDEESIRETVGDMLEAMGYSVVYSTEGNEALAMIADAALRKSPFKAVIMDLTIPGGMGGREAVEKLRLNDASATLPAFVSSGYSDDPVMADPTAFGFTDKIQKPFRKGNLSELLEKHLGKNQ